MDPAAPGEMQAYVGFTEADASILARLHPIAKPHFGAIADEFYAIVRSHEGAFALLKDEAQAQGLHSSLQVWLDELLSSPRVPAYFERRAATGRVHVRVGLDLRYVIAAVGRIRSSLVRLSDEALAGDPEASRAARLALGRACDLDLAIMIESYQDDFAARIQRARSRENAGHGTAPVEREGGGLAIALDGANVVVLCFDAGAHLLVANRKAEELTGYALDELAGGDAFELLFGDRASAVRDGWLTASSGRQLEMDADLRTRAGKTRTLRWYVTARQAPEGAAAVVVVGVDLTRDRELERRARQNERLAATEALAAGLAHEIRNPLNGANLHLSVLDRSLARTPDVPAEAREATNVLRAEIKRLSALVTGFLEIARPRILARVPADANEIARSVGALLGPEAEAQNKILTIEPFALPATAKLDVERTKQVLVNLVRNGLDAVGDGGRVVVRVRRLPHHIEMDVADDGRGIADPASPIFDAFYTTKERGTGLGLSIVHRIVTDHGGDVRFESRPGSTLFTVRIPADAGVDERQSVTGK